MKPFLYKDPILPEGFSFPPQYEKLAIAGDWPNIDPWSFLASDMALSLSSYSGMLLKFPDKPLVPFARICDPSGGYNDGYVVLACFDGADKSGQPQVRIYDFGNPTASPWDNLSYANFEDWLQAAHHESSRYKAERADFEDDE